MEMMACPNLAVPVEVMQHVVNVESSRNPFAIGVVGGQLVRQPADLGEAVATARMLEAKGYNYSLGVAQVNRANLGKFGLDTYEKAFDLCPNLVAGSQILAQCYANAGGDWGKAFSCYYSGNFTTGYEDGYVQKIFDSMARQNALATNAIPIPLVITPATVSGKGATVRPLDGSAYRVAMRSVADASLAFAMSPVVAKAAGLPPPSRAVKPSANPAVPEALPDAASIAQALQAIQAARSQVNATGSAPADGNGVFEPQVQGPDDPAPSSVATPAPSSTPAGDPADLRRGGADGAFVF
ncbi:lytic transglycosylase domain-containing protein [Luteibacter sp.]|jgi:type IV secretion system protein VirB1|uniref:lytic transglycosylase domain-containing protein n=1 Tax=Luteibacter sp. TaxID=1886636 RepID=UPI002F403984